MKKMGTVSTVVAMAVLTLAAQAFAFGGGMGGGQMGGSMGGGHQMSSGMNEASGAGMHQGPTNGTGPQHTAMNGTGAQGMVQGATGSVAGTQHGQMNGNVGMTTTHAPATTTTK